MTPLEFMSKKTIKKLIVLGIIFLLVFLLFKLNGIFKVVELTSIRVETHAPLEKNKVLIYQGYYSINRNNDAEMFQYFTSTSKIVFDKEDTGEIKTDYGENDFLIIYDSRYYFQFRQFCTNRNDYFRYNLKFYKEGGQIILESIGDGINFKKPMNLISDAAKLRCNAPIDNRKGLYNGVELK